MILRSGRMIGCDNVIIDFDEASREWKKNKQSMGLGMYRYTNMYNFYKKKINNQLVVECIGILPLAA